MTARGDAWTVRLMAPAEADLRKIVDWTRDQFGDKQADVYGQTLASAVHALAFGPTAIGVKDRKDLAEGLFTLHVAREGRRGRHFLLFRFAPDEHRSLEILRILHDSMDLPNHASRAAAVKRR